MNYRTGRNNLPYNSPRFIDYCIRLGQERKKVSIGYWKWRHREDKLNLIAVELHGKQCKKKKMLILNVKNLIHYLGYREKKIKCTDIYIFKGITLFSCLCILLIRTFGSIEVVYLCEVLRIKKELWEIWRVILFFFFFL